MTFLVMGIFMEFGWESIGCNTSKMICLVRFGVFINSKMYKEKEKVIQMRNKQRYRSLFSDDTIELEDIENMTFIATIVIEELYDDNGVKIPVEKWEDHNVAISRND